MEKEFASASSRSASLHAELCRAREALFQGHQAGEAQGCGFVRTAPKSQVG